MTTMQAVAIYYFCPYFCAMPRPKSEDPAVQFPFRMKGSLKQKFEYVAGKQRRKPTDLLTLLAEDAVAAYEKEHGPINLSGPLPSS
jgi:hypothetical protein